MKNSRIKFFVIFLGVFFLLPIIANAEVNENFDGWTGATSYSDYLYNDFQITNGLKDTTYPRSAPNSVRLRNATPQPSLEYVGSDGNGKDGGVGTISFWYRSWDGAPAFDFTVSYSVNGGAYTDIETVTGVVTTTYTEWTYDLNNSSDNIKIRITTTYTERIHIDDFYIGDYTGGGCNTGDVTSPDWTVAGDSNLVVTDPQTNGDLQLNWDDATDTENPTGIKYAVYRDTTTSFVPGPGNRIVTGLTSSQYNDSSLTNGTPYYYRIEVWNCNANSRTNTDEGSGTPTAPPITDIYDIQYSTTPGTECYHSPLETTTPTINGIVFATGTTGYMVADATGVWNGVYVYDSINKPSIGDDVTVTGTVDEYYGLTELGTITDFINNSSGNTPYAATTVTVEGIGGSGTWGIGCDADTEAYEGILVTLYNVEVSSAISNFGYWRIKDQGGTLHLGCDDTFYLPASTDIYNGRTIAQITGVLSYTYDYYRLNPRSADDIVWVSACNSGDVTAPDWTVTTDANLVVTDPASDGNLNLDWDDATDTENPTGIEYAVYRSTTTAFVPAAGNRIATGLSSSNYSDTGLDNGTTYYYRIEVWNCNANTRYNTDEGSGLPTGGCVPSDVTAPDWTVSGDANLVVTDPFTDGDLNLDWDDATDTENPTGIEYAVYRSTSTGFTPGVSNRIVTGLTVSNYSDSGLTNGTTYYYRIGTYNCNANYRENTDEGSGAPNSGCNFADVTAPDWTVTTDANLVVTDPVSDGDLNLDWDDATDTENPTGIQYAVYRSTSTGFVPAAGNRIATGLTVSNYADSGLPNGFTYYYRIETYNCASQARLNTDEGSGIPSGGCYNADVSAPDWTVSGDANLVVTDPASDGDLNLDWDDATDAENPATVEYNVYRDTTQGFSPGAGNWIATALTSSNYADSGLTNGTTYYYRIETYNCNSNSRTNTDEGSGVPTVGAAPVDPAVGELIINELFIGTADAGDYDGSEYMEIYNTTNKLISLENVYVMGTEYNGTCGGEYIWKFPTGATIPAYGFVIIVKDVADGDGFCDIFTTAQQCSDWLYIYEMYDSDQAFDADNANVPNMVLQNNTANDNQMGYVSASTGGHGNGYGASCGGSFNKYEAYYLRVGSTSGTIIDAMEWADTTCTSGDYCGDIPGGNTPIMFSVASGGDHIIHRLPNGTDTNVSSSDFTFSDDSLATPGAANSDGCNNGDVTAPDWTVTTDANLVVIDPATDGDLNLNWDDATDAENSASVMYAVYRDTTTGFSPASGNRIATGLTTSAYSDSGLTNDTPYYYRIETYNCNANTRMNTDEGTGTPTSGGGLSDPAVGELVINEIFLGTTDATDYDGAEFMEIYNTTGTALSLTNVYVMGTEYNGTCGGEYIWKFPDGASIPANGYVIVVKDVADGDGFCDIFTTAQQCSDWLYIYEMYDSDQAFDADNPNVPNMVLQNNTAVDNQMGYISASSGGHGNGYGADCGGTFNKYEAYYLRVGGASGTIIDAIEYGDNSCSNTADYCGDIPGGNSPLKIDVNNSGDHIIHRLPNGTDTNVSSDDFEWAVDALSTPGASNSGAVCNTGDVTAPDWTVSGDANLLVSDPGAGGILTLDWDDATDAENPTLIYYAVYRGTTTGFTPGTPIITALTVSNYTNSGLTDGTTYYYRIETYNCAAQTRYNTDEGAGNPSSSGVTSICDVQDYDSNGDSTLIGNNVTVSGTAIVGSGIFQPTRTSFWIQNASGCGVNIYMSSALVTAVTEGDLVTVTGQVDEYNGVTEVIAANEGAIVISGSATVPTPQNVTTGYSPMEEIEGRLVRVVGTVSNMWTYGFELNDGTGPVDIYVSSYDATGIDLSGISNGDEYTVIGIVTQYDNTGPEYLSNYEILPRRQADLIPGGEPVPPGGFKPGPEPAIFAPDLNETTQIGFNAISGSHVVIRIYNLQGVHVTTVFDGVTTGRTVAWDGKDQLRHKLPIGVYIINIQIVDIETGKTSIRNYPVVISTKLN